MFRCSQWDWHPGLKFAANNVSTGLFTGLTVSPNGQSFSGNYTVSFDMWQNYVGPVGPGGSGTTQFSQYGIGTAGTTANWIGSASKDSVSFGTTLDGGSAADFRAIRRPRILRIHLVMRFTWRLAAAIKTVECVLSGCVSVRSGASSPGSSISWPNRDD